MRPIKRGEINKTFSEYQQAKGDLIDRLGSYCSYCEMQLDASLAVEHVQPKSLDPKLCLEWSNFLLSCSNCNSTKKNKKIVLNDYIWPDRDNTFQALTYHEGGIIAINPNLNDIQHSKAQKLLDLVGLQKQPGNNPKRKDNRWKARKIAWEKACESLDNLNDTNTEAMKKQILITADSTGFWSIWMTVFKDNSDMLNRLIEKFKGTCKDCFDPEGRPIPRKGSSV